MTYYAYGVRAAAAAGLRLAMALLALLALPALAQEAPDALVKRVSQDALSVIKSDPAFKHLALVRMPSLSVVPATAAHWKRLLQLASGKPTSR